MSIHKNSQLSFQEILPSLRGRKKVILEAVKFHGGKLTDREIKVLVGALDMNGVRPRITEMLKEGYLVEEGSVKCPITNKLVRRVRA